MTTTQAKLGRFEGNDVRATTIAVTRAGDGLSEALKTEPKVLHQGETCYVVLECSVAKVRFDPIGDSGDLTRVHILRAGTATLMDDSVVVDAIDRQRDKNERAKEESEGVQRLPTADELTTQHFNGKHADGLVDGCPDCDDERDAAAAEG